MTFKADLSSDQFILSKGIFIRKTATGFLDYMVFVSTKDITSLKYDRSIVFASR